MKRLFLILLILIVILGAVGAWLFLGSATGFNEKVATLYISSKAANKKAILDSIRKNRIVTNEWAFEKLAGKMNYWENIKPGKYEINKGSSIVDVVRTLRNGHQTPVE